MTSSVSKGEWPVAPDNNGVRSLNDNALFIRPFECNCQQAVAVRRPTDEKHFPENGPTDDGDTFARRTNSLPVAGLQATNNNNYQNYLHTDMENAATLRTSNCPTWCSCSY